MSVTKNDTPYKLWILGDDVDSSLATAPHQHGNNRGSYQGEREIKGNFAASVNLSICLKWLYKNYNQQCQKIIRSLVEDPTK